MFGRTITFALLLCSSEALRFLVYNPMMARSHVNFIGKLSDVLIEAGHNVTMIGPMTDPSIGTYGTTKANIIKIPQAERMKKLYADFMQKFIENSWSAVDPFEMLQEIKKMAYVMPLTCNDTVYYPGMMDQLRSDHFDLALAEPFDPCGFVIFHMLGISKTALLMSTSSLDGSYQMTGAPHFPSYVPGGFASFGEQMTFTERLINTLPPLIFGNMISIWADAQDEFTRENNLSIPPIMDLLQNTSLTFMNRDPLVEFPAVTTHKIIDVGGLSVFSGNKPLNKTWSDILSLRKKTVLLSFGTIAKSYLMPDEYKHTIRETFRKFPDVTFIWKYEEPSHRISEGVPNIVESTFVPQNDMLYDARLSLFITHCGQGSTTEALTAGVPLIVIPVLGDQHRNAQAVKRLGVGYILQKEQLNRTDALEVAIREVLGNNVYTEKGRQVGSIIKDKPFKAKDSFLKNAEFLAKYGPLRQLDHYGLQLNFFQYYLIDVFAFLGAIVLIIVLIVFMIVRSAVRLISRTIKLKKE